ncbi:MAG: hypothetical protein CL539_01520 [Alcanivorax sp.]|uniref:PIN domain-containing protein n=1 Tax=Alcanivorax sp. UBA3183 TaxID=1945980 RepID=UPI000C8B0CE4|nr:hypothetical protein [Alcanivorax sp.]|tara:strand:+ start:383 stop:601 length:219 start_codon:yes stop_codon:yes gene_type:complete
MNYIFLDTCVLLDISTKRNDLPLVSALEGLVSSSKVKLVLADLVVGEYERNKEGQGIGVRSCPVRQVAKGKT